LVVKYRLTWCDGHWVFPGGDPVEGRSFAGDPAIEALGEKDAEFANGAPLGCSSPPPFVGFSWIGGAFTPREQHSPESAAAIKVSDDLVAEL
jgi:hypothetical protein